VRSSRFGLITFDVYSALLDFEGSLVPRVRSLCGGSADAVSLVRSWRAKQLEYAQLVNSLQRGHVAFQAVTRRALEYTLARAGIVLRRDDAEALVLAWNALDAWPEAEDTLREVKARGHPIALLSNGDEAMLRAVAASFGVAFDHVFASDQAGHYKPHPAIYALPTRIAGIAPSAILHVAGSANDVMGAKSAGMTCAWSNRHADRLLDPALAPDFEISTLAGLLEIV
jgi:2-haloacid dehalogenase